MSLYLAADIARKVRECRKVSRSPRCVVEQAQRRWRRRRRRQRRWRRCTCLLWRQLHPSLWRCYLRRLYVPPSFRFCSLHRCSAPRTGSRASDTWRTYALVKRARSRTRAAYTPFARALRLWEAILIRLLICLGGLSALKLLFPVLPRYYLSFSWSGESVSQCTFILNKAVLLLL